MHTIDVVLYAVKRIKQDRQDDLVFWIVGDSAQRPQLENDAKKHELDNIIFTDIVPKTESSKVIASSAACLAHLRGTELLGTVLPSKIFEIMSMNVPIVMGGGGDRCRGQCRHRDVLDSVRYFDRCATANRGPVTRRHESFPQSYLMFPTVNRMVTLSNMGKLKKAWHHPVCKIVRVLGLTYFGMLIFMMLFEEKLIYQPSRYPEGDWSPKEFPFQDIEFSSPDGTKLHGWFVAHGRPRAYILYCHGNTGHLAHRAYLVNSLYQDFDSSIFIFDYRGYGRSDGSPHEVGVIQDAHAALHKFAELAKIEPNQIIPMGRSLGGAVAVELAAANDSSGLILESTFTSLPDVAAAFYPWAPVRWFMRTKFNSFDKIKQFNGPLLQSHGDRDEIVPYELGIRLFDAANGVKLFVNIPSGRHNDLQSAEYYNEFGKFLDKVGSSPR